MATGMRHTLRSIFRLLGSASLLMALASTAPSPAAPQINPQGEAAAARNVEVRLRKLHLVRPDLIPYPLAYEVYC